ncbi:MAG: multicopper oxidase domain-containing protein, partial [Actinobacteria bacterium]|nr:multicopper oxidase domain-containing protein [Actinomycetota bacterium]
MRPSVRTLYFLALAVLGSGAASADVVSLGASKDNTIYSESGSESNGAGDYLFAGATKDGPLRRALVAFDVAATIPPGSTISGVTLRLYLSRTRTGDQTVSLYRVLADWGEGTSDAGGEEGGGAPATTGDATWTHRFYPSTTWTAAGGQFSATASASTIVGNGTGDHTWSSAAMVADVQSWLDIPSSNFGWIVRGNESTTRVVKRFDSRDNPDSGLRPLLEVTFTPPAATGACCAVDGTCSVALDPGGSCVGVYQGAGTGCSPNPCPQPTGACCLPDAAATCTEVTEAQCLGQGGAFEGTLTTCAATQCPVVLDPFVDALPLPAVAQPVSGTPGGAASYSLAMREIQQQLHRDLSPTTVWGFGDGPTGATYPGPTIEAAANQPVTVMWQNDLRDVSTGQLRTQHYLPVDTCMDGAVDASPRAVLHLHGAHVQSAYDGYPEATLLPNQQAVYEYPNGQLPSTLWYHDHALGITRLNVMMGLAGFYLLRDPVEQGLGLPSGEFEIPLAIQDRTFNPDGSLQYPEMWHEHFFGDTILVNGKVWPYLNVKQGKYRFRVLDGSNSRTYRLVLSTGAPFHVIGMEGGLLPAPVLVNEITLGPGERADVVIDFAPYAPGTEILLVNSAPAPFPGVPGVGVIPDVMKFVVTSQPGHTAALPASLRALETLQESDAVVTRDFELRKTSEPCAGSMWQINGLGWDDVTEYPELGTTEIWRFINRSGVTHPMHMHLVMFQVLDRQAFEEIGGNIVPIGSPVPPPPHEAGWKDTVQVGPNEILRVIARFEDFTGRFAYHCHILEHEDHEMMRQFEAVTTCGDGHRGIPDEECDDANLVADDGCSSTCQIEDECQDGIDNDGDGLVDSPADPGCATSADFLETSPALACDDGEDNDGDGFTDVPDDPGCRDPLWTLENPQCQDG